MKKAKAQQLKQEVHNHSLASPVLKLPNEILLNVFQYIRSQNLLFCVAEVCKQWRFVALDPCLWRLRVIDDEYMLLQDLNLLALAPTLHKVSLRTEFSQDLVVKALLCGKKDLKSLRLHFCHGSLNVQQLKQLLPAFPNLKHLDLQLPSASKDQALFSTLHNLTKLETLKLSGFVSPVSELINAITNHCFSLHTLHLIDCMILFRDEHLAALVSDGRPWKSLKLGTYFLSEAAYNYFACFEKLETLALIKCKSFTQANLEQIATLPCLTALTISENCKLTSSALRTCFQFQSMASLIEINLTVYRADDEVALAIATTCTQLVRLQLATCLLTDEGLRSIILNASQLEDLDLQRNIIRGQCLYLVPNHLPKLHRLNLHLCYNVLVNLNEIVAHSATLKIINPAGIVVVGKAAK